MKTIRIDFVSDVACPWCAVGFGFLEQALENLKDEVKVEIHFQPFELNPSMPPGGEETIPYLMKKYGSEEAGIRKTQAHLVERAKQAQFEFNSNYRPKVYNTFNCHRLIYWAGTLGVEKQYAMKKECLKAYFTRNENVDDRSVLLQAVKNIGLDVIRAKEILESDEYTVQVRQEQEHFQKLGINAVPSVIIENQYLVQGGQPAEVFEKTIREVLLKAA
ncbi:MAG: DsbA family oxidoreductase [Betaproteobacteria bacterium]|jgi:predicted DsbA family dithiol-disulfide isomerase